MELYELKEPEIDSLAVGIDLGTTNSIIAYKKPDGEIIVIPDKDTGSKLFPSVVRYTKGKIQTGWEAARSYDSLRSIKRLIGKGAKDIHQSAVTLPVSDKTDQRLVHLDIGDGKTVSVIDVSAEILKALKARAEEYIGQVVDKAVITVPAYFNDAARNATKRAAEIAGLHVLRLLNEPTAAAVAYGLHHNAYGTFLVYDLGGGTFDVSTLKIQEGVCKVIATAGDTELGGDDFDYILLKMICAAIGTKRSNDDKSLLIHARSIKERLSVEQHVTGTIDGRVYSVTRGEYERAIAPLVERSIIVMNKAMRSAKLSWQDLDEVIMVGGATKTPSIITAVHGVFGRVPLTNVDPELIVAVGAAIQADALTRGGSHLLLDITPISLGIELMGGIVEHIIPKNSPIPMIVTKTYTTSQDGQSGIKIHVVQGEGRTVADCRSLAYFELKGIPSMRAGVLKIDVSFKIDADGILTVSAEEQLSGINQEVVLNPTYGLNKNSSSTTEFILQKYCE